MLKRALRVHSKDFPVLMKQGYVVRTPHASFRYVKTDGESRFSVAVSSKTARTAPLRSRIRRGWRIPFEKLRQSFNTGVCGVLFVHTTTLPPVDERMALVERFLKEASLKLSVGPKKG